MLPCASMKVPSRRAQTPRSTTAKIILATKSLLIAAIFLACTSCSAGVEMVLKEPIAARCRSIGLHGCSDMTEGVIHYVSGEKEDGRNKILSGAAENAPEQVRAFAFALTTLGTIPGTESFMGPILEVANILQQAPPRPGPPGLQPGYDPRMAAPPPQPAAPVPPAPPPGPAITLTADTDLSRLEGGQSIPASDPGKVPCGAGYGAGAGYCVRVIIGPFVVTDLGASAGCPHELFASAGQPGAPRWMVVNPVAHGSRLVVKQGELLTLGAIAASESKLVKDARCSISWSGFWPYGAADVGPVAPPR